MTRRISKVIIHGGYNAVNYVSCLTTKVICMIFDLLYLISIRPTILPSLYQTLPWFFPRLSLQFVYHRRAPILTNTTTNLLLFWDGVLVTDIYEQLIFFTCFLLQVITFFLFQMTVKADAVSTGDLEQGLVVISSNENCRADTTFGQYVSENTTCVTSENNNQFTCQVSQLFNQSNSLYFIC